MEKKHDEEHSLQSNNNIWKIFRPIFTYQIEIERIYQKDKIYKE